MRFLSSLLATTFLFCLGACGTDASPTSPNPSTSTSTATVPMRKTDVIKRDDYLEVICGSQILAHGSGAAANEVVTVRIQEQVEKGIDISSEVIADANGNFILNDFCDPESPNAEVPALWTFKGASSGRTGKNMITYKLPAKTVPTTVVPPSI